MYIFADGQAVDGIRNQFYLSRSSSFFHAICT
jgi:hypothetical protein